MTRSRIVLAAALLVLAVIASACTSLIGSDDTPEDIVVTATVLRTANLFVGSEVRVLGVPVGEVSAIEPKGDVVDIELTLDGTRDYPADVNVRLTPQSLLGERFAALDPPYIEGPTLETGAHVPMERTGIPAEVDEVLRSFEEFLAALDGDALADLIDVLADTLDGNGQGLNDLIASGADTVRVLSDSSVDLNQVVRDLADLNETLATREERIGSTLRNTSTVLRNLQEDRDLLIGALNELQRAVGELQPIVIEHGDPLVRDLDTLATTLSTVDRNLERIGDALLGSRTLFETAGRVIEWENARLPLDNEAGYLADAATDRLEDRIVGLCLRLDLADCSIVEDVLAGIPDLCVPGLCVPSEGGGTSLTEALGLALASLPLEARTAIADDVAARQAEALAAPLPEPAPPVPLPQPDARLTGRGSVPVPEAGGGDGGGLLPDLGLFGDRDDEEGDR